MKEILCKLFSFFKYILLIASFGLVFFGIINTFGRLEKPLTEAVDIFIPFGFMFVMFVVSLISGSKHVSNNLLFNFVSVFAFIVIIIICLRSMFDTNMILFHRYGVNYNPSFLADNLSAVQAMLYMIGGVNVVLLLCDFIDRDKQSKKKVTDIKEIKQKKEESKNDEE